MFRFGPAPWSAEVALKRLVSAEELVRFWEEFRDRESSEASEVSHVGREPSIVGRLLGFSEGVKDGC